MKQVVIACGGAVATSTVIAMKVEELLKKSGIKAQISQTRIAELGAHLGNCHLIITSAKVDKDYGCPLLHGLAFITGIGATELEEKIISILRED